MTFQRVLSKAELGGIELIKYKLAAYRRLKSYKIHHETWILSCMH